MDEKHSISNSQEKINGYISTLQRNYNSKAITVLGRDNTDRRSSVYVSTSHISGQPSDNVETAKTVNSWNNFQNQEFLKKIKILYKWLKFENITLEAFTNGAIIIYLQNEKESLLCDKCRKNQNLCNCKWFGEVFEKSSFEKSCIVRLYNHLCKHINITESKFLLLWTLYCEDTEMHNFINEIDNTY